MDKHVQVIVAVLVVTILALVPCTSACGPSLACDWCLNATTPSPRELPGAVDGIIGANDIVCLEPVWDTDNVLHVADFPSGTTFMGNKYTTSVVPAYSLQKLLTVKVLQKTGVFFLASSEAGEMSGTNAQIVMCDEFGVGTPESSNCEMRLNENTEYTVSEGAVITVYPQSIIGILSTMTFSDAGTRLVMKDAPAGTPNAGGYIHMYSTNRLPYVFQQDAEFVIDDVADVRMCYNARFDVRADALMRITAVNQDVTLHGSNSECIEALTDASGYKPNGGTIEFRVAAGRTMTSAIPANLNNDFGDTSLMRIHGPGTFVTTTHPWRLDGGPITIEVTDDATWDMQRSVELGDASTVIIRSGAVVRETATSRFLPITRAHVMHVEGRYEMRVGTHLQHTTVYVSGEVRPICPGLCKYPPTPSSHVVLLPGGNWGWDEVPIGMTMTAAGGSWNHPGAPYGNLLAELNGELHLYSADGTAPTSLQVSGWLTNLVFSDLALYVGDSSASFLDASGSGPVQLPYTVQITLMPSMSQTHLLDRRFPLMRVSAWHESNSPPDESVFAIIGHDASLSCAPELIITATQVDILIPGLLTCLPGNGLCQGEDTCTVYPYNAACDLEPILGGVECPQGQVCSEAQDSCIALPSVDDSLFPLAAVIGAGVSVLAVMGAVALVVIKRKEQQDRTRAVSDKSNVLQDKKADNRGKGKRHHAAAVVNASQRKPTAAIQAGSTAKEDATERPISALTLAVPTSEARPVSALTLASPAAAAPVDDADERRAAAGAHARARKQSAPLRRPAAKKERKQSAGRKRSRTAPAAQIETTAVKEYMDPAERPDSRYQTMTSDLAPFFPSDIDVYVDPDAVDKTL